MNEFVNEIYFSSSPYGDTQSASGLIEILPHSRFQHTHHHSLYVAGENILKIQNRLLHDLSPTGNDSEPITCRLQSGLASVASQLSLDEWGLTSESEKRETRRVCSNKFRTTPAPDCGDAWQCRCLRQYLVLQ